jgi:16S rRNA (guanine527-N7)-methyltransferase
VTTPPLTSAEVQSFLNLDAAVVAKLERYVAMLVAWQERLNLVARSTLADPWRRHVLDSAQLYGLVPAGARTLVDLGSGAGFPGLVLAMMGVPEVTLVEARQKKCRFLEAVAAATDTPVTVKAMRAEALSGPPVDVVTARALAPLDELLALSSHLLGPSTTCLFLKGERVEGELTEARARWMMTVAKHPSLSHADGVLLEIRDVHARARG